MFSSLGALLDSLVAAIVRQEGRPTDDTNPGDLRDCPWFPGVTPLRSSVIVARRYPDSSEGVQYKLLAGGRFWNPLTRAEGIAGLYHVAALHVAELNNLQTFINIFAPPSENNSVVYLRNVMQWTGIDDASKPLYLLVGA